MSHSYILVGAKTKGLDAVIATQLYVIEAFHPLNDKTLADLGLILGCPAEPVKNTEHALRFWVAPRIGTLSPWSSKATDIIQKAGHADVHRVEKVLRYDLPQGTKEAEQKDLEAVLHDRMTQTVLHDEAALHRLFIAEAPRPLVMINTLREGKKALVEANMRLGLALSDAEIDYLDGLYQGLKRQATDVELMMFAQANSEHCRHKIFNSHWIMDGKPQDHTLFNMIRHTHASHPAGVYSAYKDNAAVIQGSLGDRFFASPDHVYRFTSEEIPILMKVETHNHPTAIAPFAGAATGAGGEIRDEGATGRGAKPKAGLAGFSVSYLRIPGASLSWEGKGSHSSTMATPLDIMIEGPLGAAAYNNEFGRPNLCGYFRCFERTLDSTRYGYHKPIMIAGGYGNIRPDHIQKNAVQANDLVIVLGGPSMLIGLGGGAASSQSGGSGSADLDFASVQRDNAECERRAQQVIDACWALGEHNPIVSIHDVGAGGLSNAVPEILHDAGCGGFIQLRDIDSADPALSPMELWCNESQERYVLVIKPASLALFRDLCERERCAFAVVGRATDDDRLRVYDALFDQYPVDLAMSDLFYKAAPLVRDVKHIAQQVSAVLPMKALDQLLKEVLLHPTVGDKSFLITIGDRSVGGLTTRDQMVGPWQVPVSDVAVTATGYTSTTGEAMSMGERAPLALYNAPASGRMAVGEALTNIAAARIRALGDIKLSANWMAACSHPGEEAKLFDTVAAIGLSLCPDLEICIPVGKDSLSMKATWDNEQVISPVSLVISAFSPTLDIHKTLTPQLQPIKDSRLILLDLGEGRTRMGGSIASEIMNHHDSDVPDLDNPPLLKRAFMAIQTLNEQGLIQAYHDRSDGGLWACLCEMAFAGRVGLACDISEYADDLTLGLTNEELGMVIQIRESDRAAVEAILLSHDLLNIMHDIGTIQSSLTISIQHKTTAHHFDLLALQQLWATTSHQIARIRENPACADQAFMNILDATDTGLFAKPNFELADLKPYTHQAVKPKVAILREQGVNGQVEMAAAFTLAGFEAIDVTMQDLISGKVNLAAFNGLAACGGFSYGDVLGAGRGWAQSILNHQILFDMFKTFFERPSTFTVGVCNGCQMLSQVSALIPGAQGFPNLLRNTSEQFEARVVMVEVTDSPSLFLQGMKGSQLPIIVSHGEGRIASTVPHVAMRYIDSLGLPTERYPYNPNGSVNGTAGVCSEDGRVTILMPHPERSIRSENLSWHPEHWGEWSPWFNMFLNVRKLI